MMRATGSRVNRIVIAGDGFEAWVTAGALAQKLNGRRVDITVCAVDGSDAWDPLYSILPAHPGDMVHQLGISNRETAARYGGSFSLGTEFSGQQFTGPQRFKPYGTTGVDYGGAQFHHYWLRNAPGQPVDDYFSYSTGARAMRKGSFAPPAERNAIGTLQHEYARHVDVSALTPRMRHAALDLGVTQSLAPFQSVQRTADGKRIERLIAASGEKVDADLFIDCTGPLRALFLPSEGVNWIHAPLSPSYDLTFESLPIADGATPWHSVTPADDGWRIEVPGNARKTCIRLTQAGERSGAFATGHVSQPWIRNCVAIGHAASAILPLEPLHVVHLMASIGRLVTLLPGPDTLPAETLEYNQLFHRDISEVHDLMALHELARCPGGLRTANAPSSLRRRIDLFEKRGWISKSDSDLIPAHVWSASFLFYGIVPQQYDLLAKRIPADVLRSSLAELSEKIEKVVSEFPPLGAYIDVARGTLP